MEDCLICRYSLQAAINTIISFNSTTSIAGITAWPNASTVASTANPSLFPSAEGNYGGASLFSGRQYIFEISSTSNPSSMQWFRSGASPQYTGGQAFRQRSPLNGAIRDMTLATTVEVVPEPTSAALIGMGGLLLLNRIRRAKI